MCGCLNRIEICEIRYMKAKYFVNDLNMLISRNKIWISTE